MEVLESFPRLRQFCTDLEYEDHLSTLSCSAGLAPPSPILEELYVGNVLEYRYMFDMGKALQACPALHSVGFSESRTDAMFRQYAAAGIVKIVNLKIHNTWHFDQMRGLHELEMKGCTCLANSSMICIAKNCPKLTLLHVHDAPNVTLPAVLAVLKRCPLLRSLECVCTNEKEVRSMLTKKREQSAILAVMEMCKLQYPCLQHLRLRFV